MRKVLWLVVSVLILTAPSLVWGAARVQSTGVVWPTIQEAIDNSFWIDSIFIEGNLTYKENLVVAPSNPIFLRLVGGWDPAFFFYDPSIFPTIIDPARDGYNLTILGSPGATAWVILDSLIFTNSNTSTHNHFTGAIHAEANGGDVWLEVGVISGNTFEKFFTGDSPGVFFLNALGSSQMSVSFFKNTIAHNFGFGDNMVFKADGPIFAEFDSNYIFDNHFDGSPGLFFFADNGASITVDLQNNLITNNTSINGVGGAINFQANSGDNRLTSINDTIYKNLALEVGGVRVASFLTSNTLVSFTNSILNFNDAKNYPNALITGNVDFGAAGCSLGSVSKVSHNGTYHAKNNFPEDPKVLGYIEGKPYLNSKSKAINRAKDTINGTVAASTVSNLTVNAPLTFVINELVGRTIMFADPAGEFRVIKSNTVTGITFNTDLPTAPGIASAFIILGAPGVDIEGRPRPQGLLPDVGCSEAYPFTVGTFDITGKLLDLYTGKTIMSGTVILESLNGLGGAVNEVLKSGINTTTGNYRFKNLSNGDYRITPHVVGYDFAPMVVNIAGADVIENFDGVSYVVNGQVKNVANNSPIAGAIPYLTVDDWQASKTDSNGDYELHAGPGDFLIFLRKVGQYPAAEFQFFPKTAEAFAVGINGTATGGGLNTLDDATVPSPWAALGMNVLNKIIVITHADGSKEIRTITGVAPNTLNLTPDLSAPVVAGDQYTIDPHGVVGTAEAGGTKSKIVDSTRPWGTTAIGAKLVIVFHAGGAVEYSSVDTVSSTPPTTINLAKTLAAVVADGDRYAVLNLAFFGNATGIVVNTKNTIIDAAAPWGNALLIGRPISYSRKTGSGTVKETRVITNVDNGTGTITVDKDFNTAPAALDSYEIDLLNYDFFGLKIP